MADYREALVARQRNEELASFDSGNSGHSLPFFGELDQDSELSVDTNKVENYKSVISKNLTNLIKTMRDIKVEYNTLIKKGYVKGSYKDVIQAAIKKVDTYIGELETRKKFLNKKIEDAKTQYMLKTISDLQKTVAELQANQK